MCSSSIRVPGGGELRIEQDVIPVHYESDLDPGWRFTDAAGHEHYYVYVYLGGEHYPTLAYVVDEWCHSDHDMFGGGYDEDGHPAVAHYECRICGEHVTPGMRGPGTTYVPGMHQVFLNGEPISRERAEEILASLAGRV
jgi:hypothetical protein